MRKLRTFPALDPFQALIGAFLLTLSSAGASADTGCMGVENVNFRMYPEYCAVRCVPSKVRDAKGKKSYYERRLGKDNRGSPAFLHVHHYCAGMMLSDKLLTTPPGPDRRRVCIDSKNNFNYVVRNWSTQSPLYPEALVRSGRVDELCERKAEAAQNYLNAIRVRPNYPPAYIALSDLQASQGNSAEASKVLRQGLKANPSSKALAARLRRLGK